IYMNIINSERIILVKSILILGGGIGGVVAANALRKKLGKEHKIIIVDKKKEFNFPPSYLWVMMGWRRPEQITISLDALTNKGIQCIQGSVSKINPENRTVSINGEEKRYDYPIISLGADLAPEAIPGLTEVTHLPTSLTLQRSLRRL
ncbi:MAG: FAD-dependent oxidoreductase, partial [Nitrososphaerales archaeon]